MDTPVLPVHLSKAALAACLLLSTVALRAAAPATEPASAAPAVAIDGRPVELARVVGTEVVGPGGEDLGEIVDLVVVGETREVAFLAARSDGWFDRGVTLIPAAAIVFDRSPEPRDLPRLESRAWWDGRRVALAMEEPEFDQLATFQLEGDLAAYLERNVVALAQAYGLSNDDIFDPAAEYDLAFRPTIDEPFDPAGLGLPPGGYTDAPPPLPEEVSVAEPSQRERAASEKAPAEEPRAEGESADAALPDVEPSAPEPLSEVVAESRAAAELDLEASDERDVSPIPLERRERAASDEVVEWKDRYVEVGDDTFAARALLSIDVVNDRNEDLGSVDDVVVNEKTGEAEFLVVGTDAWFADRAAILPIDRVDIRQPDVTEPGVIGAEARGRIKLDISEQTFDALADFSPGEDVTGYLRDRGDALAQRLGSEVRVDSRATYRLVFGYGSDRSG